MPKRSTKLATSLKQLGNIEVNDWDFMGLMNKDIRDIEITRSLRRLGNVRVTEWDFRSVIPAVNRFAHQEVDLVDIFRRTAHFKVMEWDFRTAMHAEHKPKATEPAGPAANLLSPENMQALMLRLKDFLGYTALNLIDEPGHAEIKVQQIAPDVLRFKLILVKRDVAKLIGRGGHTVAAIRSLLKAAAGNLGVHALLLVHSHEEEMALIFDPRNEDAG